MPCLFGSDTRRWQHLCVTLAQQVVELVGDAPLLRRLALILPAILAAILALVKAAGASSR
jgi:hypothetical protein